MDKLAPSSVLRASRLARNGRDWHTLLEFCSVVGALLIDAEAVYDPTLTNDRLLLGMKGTISEMEVARLSRACAGGDTAKGTAGRLGSKGADRLYKKDRTTAIEKDPDVPHQLTHRSDLTQIAELNSVRQVFFCVDQQHIQMPVVRGPEEMREIVWQAARLPRGAQAC